MRVFFTCCLTLLALCFAPPAARAQLLLQLTPPQQNLAAGQSADFLATLTNAGSAETFLNGIVLTPVGAASTYFLLDDAPFFVNVPLSLGSGQQYSGLLFRVTLTANTLDGLYSGAVGIIGGADIGATDSLARSDFQVSVGAASAAPEPGTLALLVSALAAATVALVPRRKTVTKPVR